MEGIIAPLLQKLGYRKGTHNHIIRELSLKYPRQSLGRKKKTDPRLRGSADYICEVQGEKGTIRWVIEAKSPSNKIDDPNGLSQAWSYANHPEVKAIYY